MGRRRLRRERRRRRGGEGSVASWVNRGLDGSGACNIFLWWPFWWWRPLWVGWGFPFGWGGLGIGGIEVAESTLMARDVALLEGIEVAGPSSMARRRARAARLARSRSRGDSQRVRQCSARTVRARWRDWAAVWEARRLARSSAAARRERTAGWLHQVMSWASLRLCPAAISTRGLSLRRRSSRRAPGLTERLSIVSSMGGEGGVVSMKRRYRDWRGKQWAGVGASDNTLSLVREGSDSVVSVAEAYFGGRKPLSGQVSQRSNSCRAAIRLMAVFTAWSKRRVAGLRPRHVSDPWQLPMCRIAAATCAGMRRGLCGAH